MDPTSQLIFHRPGGNMEDLPYISMLVTKCLKCVKIQTIYESGQKRIGSLLHSFGSMDIQEVCF